MGGRANLLEDGVPEFKDRRKWYDLLDGDLGAASGGLHVTQSGSNLWHPAAIMKRIARICEFIQEANLGRPGGPATSGRVDFVIPALEVERGMHRFAVLGRKDGDEQPC